MPLMACWQRFPADQQAASRLAAEVIRLTASLRTGDLTAAAAAADRAELMLSGVPDAKLARHPDLSQAGAVRPRGRRAVGGPLGRGGPYPRGGRPPGPRPAGSTSEPAGPGSWRWRRLLRGRLCRAAELAGQAAPWRQRARPPGQHPHAASLVALAWVHLQRNELREARGWLKQADAALGASPDRLTGAVAYLVAAGGALAEGRATVAAQIITRARSGWPVPAWLDQQLSLAESRACGAAGDIRAALAAAEQAGRGTSPKRQSPSRTPGRPPETARTQRARSLPSLDRWRQVPDRVRLQAWLVDARLGYASGDMRAAAASLASALRLAEREQLRLPFAGRARLARAGAAA